MPILLKTSEMPILKGQYKVGEYHKIYMHICSNMGILETGK